METTVITSEPPPADVETSRRSILTLVKTLSSDTKEFLREEVQLAKTELSEKASRLATNTRSLAIGGFVAYAGAIVFLVALGIILGYAFAAAGAHPMVSGFLGLGIVGLMVIGIGVALVMKGIKSLRQESLAPERTIQTLQELKGRTLAKESVMPDPGPDELSSQELQGRIEARENRMGETLDELGRRLSPSHIRSEVKDKIRRNPYRAGLFAMVVGLAGGLVIRRKLLH
jgi:hypothetical protein